MAVFDDVPLVDGHAHPPLLRIDGLPFAGFFSEAGDSETIALHAPHSLFFRRAIRELAELLGCPADQESVENARAAHSLTGYLRLLVQNANIEAVIVDDGYPPAGTLGVDAVGMAGGCQTYRVARVETLAEALLPEARSADELGRRLLDALDHQNGIVGLKTVIAYRSGLAVREHDLPDVERSFAMQRAAVRDGPARLTSKPLLDYLLLLALDWAGERRMPVQFHTGYGDRDLDLIQANPALLRPLLEQPRFERLTVVLLHASYPYTREASYLAAVYPRVFVDWSEVNPMLPAPQLRRALQELLALAPYSKLLYGSDAWGIPDWLWLAARSGRAALASALENEPDREAVARRILRENARELYGLGP